MLVNFVTSVYNVICTFFSPFFSTNLARSRSPFTSNFPNLRVPENSDANKFSRRQLGARVSCNTWLLLHNKA